MAAGVLFRVWWQVFSRPRFLSIVLGLERLELKSVWFSTDFCVYLSEAIVNVDLKSKVCAPSDTVELLAANLQENLPRKAFLHFDILAFWHFGILAFWHFDILAFWHFGILTFWHFGFLAFWHFGILTFWHFDILAFWHFDTLTFRYFGITAICSLRSIGCYGHVVITDKVLTPPSKNEKITEVFNNWSF